MRSGSLLLTKLFVASVCGLALTSGAVAGPIDAGPVPLNAEFFWCREPRGVSESLCANLVELLTDKKPKFSYTSPHVQLLIKNAESETIARRLTGNGNVPLQIAIVGELHRETEGERRLGLRVVP